MTISKKICGKHSKPKTIYKTPKQEHIEDEAIKRYGCPPNVSGDWTPCYREQKAFIDGYQLATDGREELEKTLGQYEAMIQGWKHSFKKHEKQIEELKAENERLKKSLEFRISRS